MKKIIPFFLLLVITFWGACHDNDNDDSESVVNPADTIKIPASFNWSTIKDLDLKITVENNFAGKNYLIEVLDHNPIAFPAAALVGKDLVKSGGTVQMSVSLPQAVQTICIRETDPNGMQLIREYPVTAQSMVIDFTSTQTTRSIPGLRDDDEGEGGNKKPIPPNVTIKHSTPSNALKISNTGGANTFEMNPKKGKAYVIKGDYTGSITFNGGDQGVELYIEGNWTNKSAVINIGVADKLVIQQGAKVICNNDVAINLQGKSIFHVSSGASFNGDNGKRVTIKGTNNTEQVVNMGTLYADEISACNLVFNSGTLNANRLHFDDAKASVTNNNVMKIGSGEWKNGTFNNNCMTEFSGNCKAEKATINLASGTLHKIQTFECEGTKCNLAGGSILKVVDQASFGVTQSTLHCADQAYALVAFDRQNSSVTKAVKFSGHVEVECSNYSKNGEPGGDYDLDSSSGARMVSRGGSTINISSSSCNDGGNKAGAGPGSVNNYPQTTSLGTTYSYIIEDTYPATGDYDMNDFVADATISYTLSGTNKMSQLVLNITLRAAGGTIKQAAAIQLDGVLATNVASVTRTGPALGTTVFAMSANGTEKGQTYAVLPITDNTHAAFGMKSGYSFINTRPSDQYWNPVNVSFTVKFITPVDISSTNILKMLNVFLINKFYTVDNRQEVHLRGYAATNKSKDVSPGGKYTTGNNLIYGVCVPGPFKYPVEYKSVVYAYPDVKLWMTSGGGANQSWQQKPVNGNIYSKK